MNFYEEDLETIDSGWENIDTSEYLFPSDIWKIRPTWEVVLKIICTLPIIVIGSLANTGLIYVVLKEKSLRTMTNLLIVNMCIADLGTCLICPWVFLCVDLFQNYILKEIGCRVDGSLVHSLTLVAVFNLSAISYDRVSAVVFNCSGRLTRRLWMTYIILFSAWIFGIIVASPLIYFRQYYERQWKNYLETYCTDDTVFLYPYWHVFAGLSVWIPLVVMTICYSAILIKLDRYESQALKSKYPIVMKYKKKVVQVLALIVLAFIICRVPFAVFIIRRTQLLKENPKTGQAESIYPLWYISRYLVLVNAAINPLLYGCSNSSMRKKLALCLPTSWLIRKKKKQKPKPYSISQLKPQDFRNFMTRSPCVRTNSNDREIMPKISSTII